MLKVIKYEDIDNHRFNGSYILIDVRSPGEYEAETIPGSINIPIFDNRERELIGTTYVQDSIHMAKRLGVESVSSKLPDIYDKFAELNKEYDKLILFCSRGGFRSSSLVSLFMTIGIDIFKIDMGYKGYRRYINRNLPKIIQGIEFVVLYGNTGTGKTDILQSLREKGKDILDLEGCANHRGSILGGVGLGEQNSQKMFESLIYESLRHRKTDMVFVEGESRKIGRVIIPEYIYESMGKGTNLEIYADIDIRISNVLRDYVHGTDDELIHSLNYLRKQLGHKTIDRYIDMIKSNNYRTIIKELMTQYYDPHYKFKDRKYIRSFENIHSDITAKDIIQWVSS